MTLLIRCFIPRYSPFRAGLLLLFLFVLLGCTVSGKEPIRLISPDIAPPDNEFVVMRDFQTSWNALLRALDGGQERTIQSKNKRTGNVTLTGATVLLEANCDCGKLGDAVLTGYGHRHTHIRLETRAPQETLLIIDCDYSTIRAWRDIHGKVVRRENIPCISNGRFEQELYQRVLGFMSP
jgi:hypothetical protein